MSLAPIYQTWKAKELTQRQRFFICKERVIRPLISNKSFEMCPRRNRNAVVSVMVIICVYVGLLWLCKSGYERDGVN